MLHTYLIATFAQHFPLKFFKLLTWRVTCRVTCRGTCRGHAERHVGGHAVGQAGDMQETCRGDKERDMPALKSIF